MHAVDSQRPPKLYRYSARQWLERALLLGEFRLRPAAEDAGTNAQILPFQPIAARKGPSSVSFLTLSLTKAWDLKLFDAYPGADCCLVIHDAEQFGERIHRATQKILPAWAGIDAAISYGLPSALGRAFSKPRQQAIEKEWLFAWRPTQPVTILKPVVIQIGNMEGIAELRGKGD